MGSSQGQLDEVNEKTRKEKKKYDLGTFILQSGILKKPLKVLKLIYIK